MSDIATAALARPDRLVPVALALALPAALVGAVAAAIGIKSRREAVRQGSGARLALAAIVVGGLVAAQVGAYALVWALGELA